ncbi:MAG: hypothetical protein K9J30_06150 [Bacteroidales bacterium]|nr:hypothetical protein [Bacteroidales bacterium]
MTNVSGGYQLRDHPAHGVHPKAWLKGQQTPEVKLYHPDRNDKNTFCVTGIYTGITNSKPISEALITLTIEFLTK